MLKKLFLLTVLVLSMGCVSTRTQPSTTLPPSTLASTLQPTTTQQPSTTLAVKVVSGDLQSDDVWSGAVLVTSYIEVPKGVTLTIEPGTVVKFQANRDYKNPLKAGMEVHGKLVAKGSKDNLIYFTSSDDHPINGDWHFLRFYEADPSSILSYAVVEYGQQGVNIWHSNVTISHCIVRYNNWEGIYLENYASPTIEYNRVYQNGYNGMAMEQFNSPLVQYNEFYKSGTNGLHVDASYPSVQYNLIHDNKANGLSLDNSAVVHARGNTIYYNHPDVGCGVGGIQLFLDGDSFNTTSCNSQLASHLNAARPVQKIDFGFADLPEELDYTPGDEQKDRYSYVYAGEDASRKVVKKLGRGLGLTWSIAFDSQGNLWTANMGSNTVYELDSSSGSVLKHFQAPGTKVWGMAFDGQNLWLNDFAGRRIFITDLDGNVIKQFPVPDADKGGSKGMDWDPVKKIAYLMGWAVPGRIYEIDQDGKLVKQIDSQAPGGGIAWDGNNFWTTGCHGLCKVDSTGIIIGDVYSQSEGNWDMKWHDNLLWVTQRTNENWQDDKIFAVQIKDSGFKT